MSDPELTPSPIRLRVHGPDLEALDLHPAYGSMVPHCHTILESWSFPKKQRAGAHIDRMHSKEAKP